MVWFSRLAFTGMIGALGVRFDVGQAEICGLEFLLGVQLRLIEIVFGVGIGILAEDQNGARFHLRPKIHHADEGMAGYAVAAFLILFRTRIEIEFDADVSGSAGHGEARDCIAERFLPTGLAGRPAGGIAPGEAPGSRSAFRSAY